MFICFDKLIHHNYHNFHWTPFSILSSYQTSYLTELRLYFKRTTVAYETSKAGEETSQTKQSSHLTLMNECRWRRATPHSCHSPVTHVSVLYQWPETVCPAHREDDSVARNVNRTTSVCFWEHRDGAITYHTVRDWGTPPCLCPSPPHDAMSGRLQ